MKTIEISDEMYNSLMEISEELNTQSHRATAMPYFFQIQTTEDVVTDSDFSDKSVWIDTDNVELYDDSEIKEHIIDVVFEDDYDTKEEATAAFEMLSEDEITSILEENEFEIRYLKEVIQYQNTFFTEKACKAHIKQNHYHYNKPTDFLNYANRNPEMEAVMQFLCELNGGKLHK